MSYNLLQGDCLELMKKIPDGSVDLVLTDPPYGMDYQSSRRTDKTKRFAKIKNDKTPFIWFLHDAARILKDDGCLMVFCRWDSQEVFRVAIECAGLSIKNQLIWDRVVHGMGDLKGNFAPQHDVIWFATKGAWKVPKKRPKTVLKSLRLSGNQLTHPNEKPIDLMTQCIESTCRDDAVVLDCFMGSGTTGVACLNTGRRFIGFELDPHYFEVAKNRIEAARPLDQIA